MLRRSLEFTRCYRGPIVRRIVRRTSHLRTANGRGSTERTRVAVRQNDRTLLLDTPGAATVGSPVRPDRGGYCPVGRRSADPERERFPQRADRTSTAIRDSTGANARCKNYLFRLRCHRERRCARVCDQFAALTSPAPQRRHQPTCREDTRPGFCSGIEHRHVVPQPGLAHASLPSRRYRRSTRPLADDPPQTLPAQERR